MYTVDAMIPVWNPDERLRQNVELLLRQTYEIRKITLVFSVDSLWNVRETEEWFAKYDKVEIVKILREDYNHGGTRHH